MIKQKYKMKFKGIIIFLMVGFWISCTDMDDEISDTAPLILQKIELPSHFPQINFPDINTFTSERWYLGKKLFYDKRVNAVYYKLLAAV